VSGRVRGIWIAPTIFSSYPACARHHRLSNLDSRFLTLEDANSIQVALAKVVEQLVSEDVDHKAAALTLYALQTASMNLKRTSLEPIRPTQVIIDRQSVANRPIGASAWSRP
jgi:hypothetical protein